MRRRRRTALLAAAALALVAAGCGSEDLANDARPPAPVELSAAVNAKKVLVATTRSGAPVGAGPASFTISNQNSDPVALTFGGASEETTNTILPGDVLYYQIDLVEGPYTVSADDPAIRAADFEVGPERPSARNDLLLP